MTDLVKPKTMDVIIAWPDNMDYPLWREFILKELDRFNKVFVVVTETNSGFYWADFLDKALNDPKIEILHTRMSQVNDDWRNVAVNMALDKSTAEWVWFTEQDLMITDERFWFDLAKYLNEYDVIGYKDGATRMHPCNLFVKREFINKTSRNFGIVPDRLDHFAVFYQDLRRSGAKMKHLKYDNQSYFSHMNGLSSNLSLIQRGELPNYKPDDFDNYLWLTMECPLLDFRYKRMVQEYLNNESA